MAGTKLFVCNIIVWLVTSSKLLAQAEERQNCSLARQNEIQAWNVLPGIKFVSVEGEVAVRVRMRDLLQETEMQSRKKKNEPSIFQRIGYMMMMTPLVMQVLSLPGAIASVKMSLLRSLMVAQLAIAILFYNLLKNAENKDVVIVHQPPQHTHHYHHGYHSNDEDEWFGR